MNPYFLIAYTYCVIAWTAMIVTLYDERMMRIKKLCWCVVAPFHFWLIILMGIWEWMTEDQR